MCPAQAECESSTAGSDNEKPCRAQLLCRDSLYVAHALLIRSLVCSDKTTWFAPGGGKLLINAGILSVRDTLGVADMAGEQVYIMKVEHLGMGLGVRVGLRSASWKSAPCDGSGQQGGTLSVYIQTKGADIIGAAGFDAWCLLHISRHLHTGCTFCALTVRLGASCRENRHLLCQVVRCSADFTCDLTLSLHISKQAMNNSNEAQYTL